MGGGEFTSKKWKQNNSHTSETRDISKGWKTQYKIVISETIGLFWKAMTKPCFLVATRWSFNFLPQLPLKLAQLRPA